MLELILIPILSILYRIRGGWIKFGSTQLARSVWAVPMAITMVWLFSVAPIVSWYTLIFVIVATILTFGSLVLFGHGAHQDGGTWLPANSEEAHKVTENLTRWFPNYNTKPLWVRELWDWFGMTIIRFVGALIVFSCLTLIVPWYLILIGAIIVGLISGFSYTIAWIAYNNYYIKENVSIIYKPIRALLYYKGKIVLAICGLINQGKPTEIGELATGLSYSIALLVMWGLPKFFL